MAFEGMDIEAILGVADQLRTQATKINTTMRDVDRVIALAGRNWQGPNVPQFRTRWEGQYRRAGLATAEQLNNLADIARRNAETQRTTSNTLEGATGGGGGGIPGSIVPPWLQTGLEWLGDKVTDGISWADDQLDAGAEWVNNAVDTATDWVGDQAAAGADWLANRATDAANLFTSIGGEIYGFVAPRVQAVIPAVDRFIDGLGIAASQWTQLFTDGRVPQLSEVLASGAIVLGTGTGVIWNAFSGKDNKLLDPGTPTAKQPVPVGSNAAPITNFTTLTQATMDVYGDDKGIRVSAVTGADGVTRYIVNIPGTESGGVEKLSSWQENTNGRNWSANLYAMAQGSSSTNAQAVQMAMQNAGIPPGAEVLLTGHSQGGLVAANLAADPSFAYNVKGIVTYGSPVQSADFPSGSNIPVLSINHGNETATIPIPVGPLRIPVPVVTQIGDVVPQTDFSGALAFPFPITMPNGPGGNITTIDLPPLGPKYLDITANHEQVGYINSLNNATTAQQQQTIANFENTAGLSDFYQGPGTTTTSVYVGYGGK